MKMLLTTTTLFVLSSALLTAQSNSDARSIMQRYQAATAIEDLSSQLTYTNISSSGRTQTRTLKQHILCNDRDENTYNLRLEFTAPRDVAGTATLTIQHPKKPDDQWLYLPALRSSKRISASKKADRFMGTEMTYEDLSNYLSEALDDYQYKLLATEDVDGRMAYKIEALPRNGLSTQYSKRHLWVDQRTHLMLQTHFFDQKGSLLKVYKASDIRPVASTKFHRAHTILLRNEKTGNRTEVQYKDFAINQGVSPQLFSKTALEIR